MLRRTSSLLLSGLFILTTGAIAQQREITGIVTSQQTGQPIAGATVTVEGTGFGTLTNTEGRFQVAAPAGDVTLVVRSLGFRTAEVPVAANETSVALALEIDALNLDKIVVTGRATGISRRNLATAVATIDAEQLTRAPSEGLGESLQGKVTGAVISHNSGAPGGGMQFRLRGITTLNANSSPLFVVDGVIVSNATIPSGINLIDESGSFTQDDPVNRIADLNPNDIASIEILKGASAAAIYGSKAANGVILITTKTGQPGEMRINLTQRFGVNLLSNKIGSRTFETAEEVVSVYGENALQYFEPGRTFDFEEQLAGREALSTETAFSIGGGSVDTRYYASGLIKDNEGIIRNTGYEKQSLRLNLDQRVGDRVNVSLRTNVIHSIAERGLTNNDNTGTSFYVVYASTPSFFDLSRNDNGLFPLNPFERSNPLETATLMENEEEVWRYIVGGDVTVDLLSTAAHSLRFTGTGGVDYFTQENELFFPPRLEFEPNDGLIGTSVLSQSSNRNLNADLNLVYTFSPTDADWEATTSVGAQYSNRNLKINRIFAQNLVAGERNVTAGTSKTILQTRRLVKTLGFYAQEQVLLFNDRLFLTAGIRADRSSLNGDPSEYFYYPKFSGSYRFIEPVDFVDEFKIRAAYGESGNRPLYGRAFTTLDVTNNIQGLPAIVLQGTAGDPNIQPEQQTEIEGGFDAVLLDDRATVSFTVYQKTINQLLLNRDLPGSTGFGVRYFNGGELVTNGVGVQLAMTPIQTEDFTWFSSTTFSHTESEVTELPIPAYFDVGFSILLGTFRIKQGKSPTLIWGLEDGEIAVVGDAQADFTMGFANEFTLPGGLSLYALVDWRRGGDIINLTKLLFDFGANTSDYDEPLPNSDLTVGERRIQQLITGNTDPYIDDGGFVKLREVSISYPLPPSWVGAILGDRIEAVRLDLSARNVLTFTDYPGLTPEVSNFGIRQFGRSIDVAPFPPSRSIWFGIDVAF